MTPEEAEKALAEAPCVPLTEKQIHRCVEWVLSQENKALRMQRDELLKAAKAACQVLDSLGKKWCPDCEEDTALEMREILQAAIAKVEQKEA